MNPEFDHKRRQLLKAGLTLTLLNSSIVYASSSSLPELLSQADIFAELYARYGERAYTISESDIISLQAPQVAENGQVTAIKLNGDINAISSFVLFATANRRPLVAAGTLHTNGDTPLSLRIKLRRSSDVLYVADTYQGLIACKALVKVTIGCGEI